MFRKKNNLPTFRDILRFTPDLYLILDPEFNIIEVSEAYLHATMVKRENILGRGIFEVFPDNPNDPNANGVKNLRASLERVLKNKMPDAMRVQKYDIRKPESEGGQFEERYWSPVNTPILNDEGAVQYIIHRAEDVTEFIRIKKSQVEQKKVAEELRTHVGEMEVEIYRRAQEIHAANQRLEIANDELQHMAYFDPLTNLANRKLLTQNLHLAIRQAKTNQKLVAVMFLDLDRFKLINDTLGHKIGDMVLQIIAKRITADLDGQDLVARLGGDEFVILLKDIKDKSEIEKIANRILKKIAEPLIVNEHRLFVSSSIGISVFPEDSHDDTTLLKHADIAMYHAKHAGRNNYQFCTLEMIDKLQQKVALETDLRDAINNKKFILYYQPQVDLKSEKISGMEVLLRLSGVNNELILPEKFISIAEETGLIVQIGEWVIHEACVQYKIWERLFEKNSKKKFPLKLAINLSARQIKEPGFLSMVESILDKTQISPNKLEFEITEYPIISDIEESADILNRLKAIGVRIALDDFGVGYSSLNYLRQFNIDTLKIDKILMNNVPAEIVDCEIITSIITMAHAMAIEVIAEGVETKEQVQFLMKHQCDKVQSYYFHHPLSVSEMTKIIDETRLQSIS